MCKSACYLAFSMLVLFPCLSSPGALTNYQATGVAQYEFVNTVHINGVYNSNYMFTGESFLANFAIDSDTPLGLAVFHTGAAQYTYYLPAGDQPLISVAGADLGSFGYTNASQYQLDIIPRFYFQPGSEVVLTATYPLLSGNGEIQFQLVLTSTSQLTDGNLSDLPPLNSATFTPNAGVTVAPAVPEPTSLAMIGLFALLGRRPQTRLPHQT